MLDDYKKAVISNYHYKREKSFLSAVLTHPTPAQLRDECLRVLNGSLQKKDEQIIKDFFNSGIDSNDYSDSIKRLDIDRLRPLSKFLRGKTGDPDPRNVELLAWLIDFEPRPYKFTTDYSLVKATDEGEKQEEIKLAENRETVNKGQDRGKDLSGKSYLPPWIKKQKFRRIAPVATLLFLLIGWFFLYRQSNAVYICNSGTAKKYHLNRNCPSLGNCKSSVIQINIAEAKKEKRILCGFED